MFIRISILVTSVLLSGVALADSSPEIPKELLDAYYKEKRLDAAAFELFLALREKYGSRLRVAGQLVYCRDDAAAEKVQPVITDLILDGDEMLDRIDLKKYQIDKLERKPRMELIRRAVTGTTVYMFAANDHGELLETLLSDQKTKFCKSAREASEQIIREIEE